MGKIITSREELQKLRKQIRESGEILVFTNGCVDIIHAGHVDYLNKAKAAGDKMLVALNSDSSVQAITGKNRPIIPLEQRAFVMSNLSSVDYVTCFSEETPAELIADLIPDVLVKGQDWALDEIVGHEVVQNNGGKVVAIEFVTDQSTSKIIKKIVEIYKD